MTVPVILYFPDLMQVDLENLIQYLQSEYPTASVYHQKFDGINCIELDELPEGITISDLEDDIRKHATILLKNYIEMYSGNYDELYKILIHYLNKGLYELILHTIEEYPHSACIGPKVHDVTVAVKLMINY